MPLFGLNLNANKSKTQTTSTSATNSTTTPTLPDWATGLTQTAAGRVNRLFDLDPGGLVAPANGLQRQAADAGQGLTGAPWNFDGGLDVARGLAGANWMDPLMGRAAPHLGEAPAVQGESVLKGLSGYMSPFTRDVVDTTLADYDFGAGQTRAQQDLALAGAGAFGGSGAALTRAATEDALVRGRASTSASLRDQAFNRAASLSNLDAERRQQANLLNAQIGLQRMSQNATLDQQERGQQLDAYQGVQDQRLRAANLLGELSSMRGAEQRANIETQAGLGDSLRAIEQQQRTAPVTQTQQIVAMLSGLPIGLFAGEQVASNTTASGTEKTKGVSAGATVSWG